MGRGALTCAAVAAILGAACGGGEAPRAAPAGPIDLTARPVGPADAVVARVDGRPVYASCVAAQATGRRLDARAALDECVGFELLAGAAAARGLAADPDVAAARRDAGAVRLLDREFRERYRTWGDLPSDVTGPELTKYEWRLDRPESRLTFLVRVEAPVPGSPADAIGERVMKALYARFGARGDLFGPEVEAAVREAVAAEAQPPTILAGRADPTARDFGLETAYREAIWALPDIGHMTPPIRSKWGWDVLVWTDVRRPPKMTRAELAGELFESTRQRFFGAWVDRLMRGHDVAVADEASLRKVWGP